MRRFIIPICTLLLAALTGHAQYFSSNRAPAEDLAQSESGEAAKGHSAGSFESRQNCTLIYAADDRTVLAGSNEDSTGHLNDIWFLPPEKGKFGRVYLGLNVNGEHIPQGGMNDRGLFYDGASAESVVKPPRDPRLKPPVEDLHLKAIEECSTVEEVLKLYESHQMSVGDGQVMFGDRFGNSVIMEATGNVIRKKGNYQIATNFFQSRIKPENITDARFRLANKIFNKADTISIDLFRKILDATHWEAYSGSKTATLYSYICDLKKGDIYIYHFHDFENGVKLNLREELEKGERYLPVPSVFPYETYAVMQHKANWILDWLKERTIEKGVEGAEGSLALFNRIKRGDFDDYRMFVVEGHLIALGHELLENDETEQAIKVFEFAVQEYPESDAARFGLGEAHLKHGDTRKAIEDYRKSLELNPGKGDARERLKEIDKEQDTLH